MTDTAHSAQHFTPSRDFWWHADYLDLLARRLGLERCRSVLEVGAGVGHWTAQLVGRCAAGAAFTATDREEIWVERLRERFAGVPQFTAVRADVADLSAVPATFDLVSCQTLLLHVNDVPGALAQMKRCLVPGGLLLFVEPDNFSNRMPRGSVLATLTPADYGQLAAMWWAWEIGRTKLGLGREWIGELLPKMIVDSGLEDLRVYQNDRLWPWAPPYDTEVVTALRAEGSTAEDDAAEEAEARRFVLEAGYDATAFESAWRLDQHYRATARQAVESGAFSSVDNGHSYIFAARRPVA